MTPEQTKSILGWLAGAEHQRDEDTGDTSRTLLPKALFDVLADHLLGLLGEDTTHTVVIYWPEKKRYCQFEEVECNSAQQATDASIQAQVEGAETVRIFKGGDVSEAICDWKEISDRIEAGRKKKAIEEKARHQQEVLAALAQQKATQEKYERLQLQKLLAKYPDAAGTNGPGGTP